MKPLVLYHGGGCFDGFCAAWVARRALGDIEAVPVQYGQAPPDVADRDVYIVDFSYSHDTLLAMWQRPPVGVRSLVVLDHHKTAAEELRDIDKECVANGLDVPTIIFDMNKSGGRLAWEYFFKGFKEPASWLVDYTEDRDLWLWRLPLSREINATLRSYPLDFSLWDDFAKMPATAFAAQGRAILRREQQIVDEHVRHARTIRLCNHNVRCVNATVLFSEIAGELAKGYPFGICYFDRGDGKRQWSLRSDKDGADVAEIAKMFGGGGHRHAAGFETATDGLVTPAMYIKQLNAQIAHPVG